jgi:sterol desaturase/sphingolipid hydroxylase (fatty acid hydroxylase superfamily)
VNAPPHGTHRASPARVKKWITPVVAGAAFALILWSETRRPLRRQRESKARRAGRNATMAGLSAIVTHVLQARLLDPLAQRVDRDRLGLLNRIDLPRPVRIAAGVLLLDYTLWWWHVANHGLPLLWRFHLVHHVDRDLDATTAARFHFGEMALSVFFRAAQFRLLGVSREAASLWQMLLLVSIAFHHSNLRLPADVERRLVRWIVTPRMHGIHHSDYRDETNSNWSSLFSWWDYVHGTFRYDIPQSAIDIGVPAYQRPADVTLDRITALPFVRQREDWTSLDGEERIHRRELPAGAPESADARQRHD